MDARRAKGLWLAFLAILAGAFLYYGSVSPGAVASVAAALAALQLVALAVLREPPAVSRATALWLTAVASVFALQLAPGTAALFPWTAAVKEGHGVAGRGPGTADAYRTVNALAQIAACSQAGLLVAHLVRAGLDRAFAAGSLLAVLGLEAVFGLIQAGFVTVGVPFYGPRPDSAVATGTLVNRNHFAGAMAIGIALAAGLAWARLTGTRAGGRGGAIERGAGWALLAALLGAALAASQSRGGALAAFASLAAFPFLAPRRPRLAGLLVLAAVTALTVAAVQGEPLLTRFESMQAETMATDTRVECWRATVAGWTHQPVLGFGIGAYPVAFHPFQPPELPGQFSHAHSEPVNVLFEGGAVWLGVLTAGLGLWGVRTVRGLKELHGAERVVAAACVAAIGGVAVHAWVDFTLRIPAVGVMFGGLLGLAPAAAPVAGRAGLFAAAVALVTLASAAAVVVLRLDPGPQAVAARAIRDADTAGAEVLLARALSLSPCDGALAWDHALLAARRGDADLAARRFILATDLWPAHPTAQRRGGVRLWEMGRREEAAACFRRLLSQDPAATATVFSAIWTPEAPSSSWDPILPTPASAARFAVFLARRGFWRDAAATFNRHVPVERSQTGEFDRMAEAFREEGQWGLEASVREARLRVRSDPAAHVAAARAWLRLGAFDPALDNARIAARIDPRDASHLALAAEIQEAKGDAIAALEVWAAALAAAPAHPEFLLRRAALSLREGLADQAADDYRSVLSSRPAHRAATLGLARALLAAGRGAEALGVLDAWLAQEPGDAEAVKLKERGR